MESLRNILRKQKTRQRVYLERKAVQMYTNQGELSMHPAQTQYKSRGNHNKDLIEDVVSKQNVLRALRRIEKNKGDPGIELHR